MAERLLIVEDEETLCESLKRVLVREGYSVDTVDNAEAAIGIFEEGFYDLIITDIILPGITGIELLKKIKERLPEQIVIIMTAYASLETAVEALRAGAYDYVVKPVMHEEIKQIVRNALRQGALLEENLFLRKQLEKRYDLSRMIGESPAMKRVIDEAVAIAATDKNVLIIGETGTGKELIARAIHLNSPVADKPFVPVNFSSIPEGERDPELFGYLKGAFHGALTSKKGILEKANGGTVFLREISDLSDGLQLKLSRVMKERGVRPVGGVQDIRADIRFISATNMETETALNEGLLRDDFFQVINGVTLRLPPLRDRKEDIRPLADYFISMYSTDLCRKINLVDDAVMDLFERYHWPGNVRELQNVIEHAILVSSGGIIRAEHFPQLLDSC
ncbi:MAG: sigma-54-dependent Fis family transcriptional regulator [Nitrospirae bacterium]|nr:sigma-54-dependent Fis family transcriptional regulator [Nitrospirota bacterium]